jgi:hypothetical protein
VNAAWQAKLTEAVRDPATKEPHDANAAELLARPASDRKGGRSVSPLLT